MLARLKQTAVKSEPLLRELYMELVFLSHTSQRLGESKSVDASAASQHTADGFCYSWEVSPLDDDELEAHHIVSAWTFKVRAKGCRTSTDEPPCYAEGNRRSRIRRPWEATAAAVYLIDSRFSDVPEARRSTFCGGTSRAEHNAVSFDAILALSCNSDSIP